MEQPRPDEFAPGRCQLSLVTRFLVEIRFRARNVATVATDRLGKGKHGAALIRQKSSCAYSRDDRQQCPGVVYHMFQVARSTGISC
jgi:hypothetical protein